MNVGKWIIFMYHMYNSVMPSKGNMIVPAQFSPTEKHSLSYYNTQHERAFFKKQIIQKVLNFCRCAGKWAGRSKNQAKDKCWKSKGS